MICLNWVNRFTEDVKLCAFGRCDDCYYVESGPLVIGSSRIFLKGKLGTKQTKTRLAVDRVKPSTFKNTSLMFNIDNVPFWNLHCCW